MSSYNSYDGIPVITSHHMQEEILRGEWGYEVRTTRPQEREFVE